MLLIPHRRGIVYGRWTDHGGGGGGGNKKEPKDKGDQRASRRDKFEVMPFDGIKEPANLARGERAIEWALENRQGVEQAMWRPEVGAVDFPWGIPGDPANDYRGGGGLSHILAKHKEKDVRRLPMALLSGTMEDHHEGPHKKLIKHGDYLAILTKNKQHGRAYRTDGQGRHPLHKLYATRPSLWAAVLGAVRTSNLPHRLSSCKGFANSTVEGLANGLVAPVFEVRQGDGLFIPYGDFPHRKGLQRFDRAAADRLAANFNAPPSWVKRAFNWLSNEPLGVPVYIGHPDVPEVRDRYPDKKAYGWVTAVEPQPGGVNFVL